jgi:uncharacterized protein with ATP-grasp and redox domains
MKLDLNCGSCLIKQALYAMELNGIGYEAQNKIIQKLIIEIPDYLEEPTPSHFQSKLMQRLSDYLEIPDLYVKEKMHQNDLALEVEDLVAEQIGSSTDPLHTAALYSVEGNFLDPIFTANYDLKKSIKEVVNGSFSIDHFDQFVTKLTHSAKIVYVCDNAGEIVFDRLFIGQIQNWRKSKDLEPAEFSIIVKSGPVLNDAMLEDASATGLDSCGKIIPSGSNFLGLPFDYSSPEVISLLLNADLIISKGQANFETLEDHSELYGKIFFFLKAKCIHIAEFHNVPQASSILYYPA